MWPVIRSLPVHSAQNITPTAYSPVLPNAHQCIYHRTPHMMWLFSAQKARVISCFFFPPMSTIVFLCILIFLKFQFGSYFILFTIFFNVMGLRLPLCFLISTFSLALLTSNLWTASLKQLTDNSQWQHYPFGSVAPVSVKYWPNYMPNSLLLYLKW